MTTEDLLWNRVQQLHAGLSESPWDSLLTEMLDEALAELDACQRRSAGAS